MDTRKAAGFDDIEGTIKSAISVVAAVFAAFGGFLAGIAPQLDFLPVNASFAVGLASFTALGILLVIRALVKGTRRAARNLAVAGLVCLIGFVGSSLAYADVFGEVAFHYPPDGGRRSVVVGGSDLLPQAADTLKKNPGLTKAKLLLINGGDPADVWTEASIRANEWRALIAYLFVTVLAAAWVFLLVESLIIRNARRAQPPATNTPANPPPAAPSPPPN